MKKLDINNLLHKFNNTHDYFYDYSLVNYINIRTKIKIICPVHGMFDQTPKSHMNGSGCPKCNSKQFSNDFFISKLKSLFSDKYDYSLVNYINIRTKVKIICPIHGIFQIYPKHLLLYKIGCYKCKNGINFINKSNKVHNNKYNYENIIYENSHTKVNIKCLSHGIFKQLPYQHLNGHGCPTCNESKGEKEISSILENHQIKYIKQKIFKDCKFKSYLKFDFYLPDFNTCIEFDGEQHFMVKENWGGEKEFKNIQKRDKIKNEYCKNNNIKLIRIKYDDNTNKVLSSYFNK
ncbi:MAG: hypothetical protein ACOC3Z_01185, partial [Nanoarchaeota archaeon]